MAELLLYQKPARLNSSAHAKLRFNPLSTFDFASKLSSIPIIAAEFPVACRQYPIVFVEGPTGGLNALAILSFEKDRNSFLDAKGNWTATYVPAFIRRYPFVLAEIPGKSDDFDVAYDEGSGCFDKKKGEPLFDDQGAPSKFLQEQIDFLRLFHVEFQRTQQFLDTLKKEELLTPYNVDIVRGGDNARFAVRSAMVINESKLHSLTPEKASAYLKNGFMGLMYAQLISLQSFLALANRTSEEAVAKTPWWAK